jgi:hypothetical protein
LSACRVRRGGLSIWKWQPRIYGILCINLP